jgi:N-acetylglucosamine-6-sulfatase
MKRSLYTLALVWLFLLRPEAASAAEKRNIVFILIDDLRYDAFGFMGHPFVETPNIDSLAKDGVVFSNAFVTTSLCSPSRASILTGLYAHKHGILNNSTSLPDSIPTFPRELQRAGYKTGFIGKWHMGGETDEPRPGFDRWVSFRGQGVYNDPTLNIDGKQEEVKGYTTDLLTDQAVDFIESSAGKPFMLYLSHKAVHADFHPADRYKGCYSDKPIPHPATMANTEENYAGKPDWVRAQRDSWHGVDGMYNGTTDFDKFVRDYCETLRAVDDSVGRVVEALKKKGQLESTLLVFTSDNGFLFGEHGLIDKRCMYEPSIRVPLIVHCPEVAKGGITRPEMILNVDFAPTFLAASGMEVPSLMQGKSFWNLLSEAEKEGWRDAFLYEYFWERSFPQTPTVFGVRTDRYKLMQYHGIWDRYEMYDLQEDPQEQKNLLADFRIAHEGGTLDNLIAQKSNGEVKRVYRDLRKRLTALLEETGASEEPKWGE